MRYDRGKILVGEWWRTFTAHILHLGWGHLWMNLGGLLLVLFFFGNCLPLSAWLLGLIFCSFGISALTLGLNPEIHWYVGLSGVLHGLFIIGGIADIKVRPAEGWIFLALITAKLGWEQFQGPLPGSEEMAGGPVLTEAHLYGAVCGLLLWPLLKRLPPDEALFAKKTND